MKVFKIMIGFLLPALLFLSFTANARDVITLSDGWGIKPQAMHIKSIPFDPVTIPHTWNAEYIPGTHNYPREMMVYHRFLEKTPEMEGKRAFLYFEGANSACDVFINHHTAGSHLGGYTAFCLEITDLLKDGVNDVEVWVSNAYRTDILPIMGDFNVCGGLHRPVHLIITDKECISPLFYASPGVLVRQNKVKRGLAEITVSTLVSSENMKGLSVRTTISDASGKVVASGESKAKEMTDIRFSIKNPRLWQAAKDPYLYKVKSELLRGGRILDAVEQETGFRSISVDAEKGFFLNGEPYDLRGFCRHEYMEGRGSALIPEDYAKDIELVKESGATALRLVHYPHSEIMYDLSDKNGLVLMTEIPMCGPGGYQFTGAIASDGFMRNARQSAYELVYQKFNHPSVCFWGIFNEILDDNGRGRYGYDDPQAIASEINDIYHSIDRSRPTTLANAVDLPLFLNCADVIGINHYYAWYGEEDVNENVGSFFDRQKALASGKPVAITEYGGGASIRQHESPVKSDFNPSGRWHPEENQNRCHELNWEYLKERKYLWAKFIWVFQDFQSQIRTEGDKDGYNDKGLVTADRKVKKDAFYFYKAQWNPEPMVYITSRRYVERTDASTEIKVYSNLDKVTLSLNGKDVASGVPDDMGRFSCPVTLAVGENVISASGMVEGKEISDTCRWTLAPEPEHLPAWQEGWMDIHNIATGKGDSSFIIMPDGTTMLIDAGDVTGGRFKCDAYPNAEKTPGQWIANYIRYFSGRSDVDYFLLTHLHSDHMGSVSAMRPGPHYGLCGIMDVGEEIHFDKIVDRGWPDYDFPSYEKNLKGCAILPEYIKFIKWQSGKNGSQAEKFDVGSHKQFTLRRNPRLYKNNFDVFNLAAASIIATGKGHGTRKLYAPDNDPSLFDENMNSCAILVRYGNFKYYNGGDMSGTINNYPAKYRDWESAIADLMGPVTVMKADHHAWKDTMTPYFLWKTRPDAIVVQCSHINHPWKDSVQRIVDRQMPGLNEIYCTTDAGRSQVGEELFSNVKGVGHIVIRVYEGGTAYQIFVLDNSSTDYHIIGKSEIRELMH